MTTLARLTVTLIITLSTMLTVTLAEAAVIINEIAWMGGAASANHEWIELYNTSDEPIDVTGWTIKDGMNLNINLSGTIAGGAYAVLERTSDDSAPGPAFLIYTGALVNTGATLTLRNADGQIVDQVAGGENWQNIGGDNTTKETAQYTSTGWVTDTPTPGAPNNSGRTTVTVSSSGTSQSTSGSATTRTTSQTKSQTVSLTLPDATLRLQIDGQSLAYVNQPLRFSSVATGVASRIVDSLQYNWNFGDTNTATGSKAVSHRYAYPGTYVVTLRAGYARHEQVVRHEITILPVTFSLTKNERGDIQLHNDAPYDVDISNYRLVGVESLTLPPHSIMLPRSTITVPSGRLGVLPNSLVALYDQAGNLVASTLRAITPVVVQAAAELPAQASVTTNTRAPLVSIDTPPSPAVAFTFASDRAAVETETIVEVVEVVEIEATDSDDDEWGEAVVGRVSSLPTEPSSRELAFGFLVLLLVSVVYLLLRRRPTQSSAV